MIRKLHPVVLLFISLSLLASISLRAQESFNATHMSLLFPSPSVTDEHRSGGIGIFRAERVEGIARFRVTIVDPTTPITGVDVQLRQPSGARFTVSTLEWPAGAVTAEGSVMMEDIVFEQVDRGTVYLVVKTEGYPDGFVEGRIETFANFYAFEFRPGQEVDVPDNSSGRGTAYIIFDEATRSGRYLVTWQHLTGPADQARFYRGAPKQEGSPVHTLMFLPGDSVAYGTWSDISNDDIAALKRGDIYVNVHTANYPKGEIRAHMVPTHFFTSAIRPEHAVPMPNASNVSGTGYLIHVTLPGMGEFMKSYVAVGGTGGTIDSVHLHNGAVGTNGPKIIDYPEEYVGLWELEHSALPGMGIGDAHVAALRAGNVYVDIHTAGYPDGEARGQWIPGATNLTEGSSGIPATPYHPEEALLAAHTDRSGSVIRFTIVEEEPGSDRRILLYSSLGNQVAGIEATESITELHVGSLPSGTYIARLVIDGRARGICRVAIVR